VPAYVVTQVVAGGVAAAVLLVIAGGIPDFSASDGFASNGYGDLSPGGYSLTAAIVTEVVPTAFFLYVILGVTDTRAPKGLAPLAIGLALTLIHLGSRGTAGKAARDRSLAPRPVPCGCAPSPRSRTRGRSGREGRSKGIGRSPGARPSGLAIEGVGERRFVDQPDPVLLQQ
jgi:hypothetical protein